MAVALFYVLVLLLYLFQMLLYPGYISSILLTIEIAIKDYDVITSHIRLVRGVRAL